MKQNSFCCVPPGIRMAHVADADSNAFECICMQDSKGGSGGAKGDRGGGGAWVETP